MASDEPSPLPSLADLAAQVAQVQAAVIQLQQVARVMAERLRQPPVHLAVEHLEVHTLEFRLDSIDVDSLSGELNIGLTSKLKVDGEPPQRTPSPRPRRLRGALLGSAIDRWRRKRQSTPHQPRPQGAESHLLWPGSPANRPEKEADRQE